MDVVPRRGLSRDLLAEVMLPGADWLLGARRFMLSNWRKHAAISSSTAASTTPQDLLRFTAEAVDRACSSGARRSASSARS